LLHKLEVQAEKEIMLELQEITKEKEKENEWVTNLQFGKTVKHQSMPTI
jgi:hypothetical protein